MPTSTAAEEKELILKGFTEALDRLMAEAREGGGEERLAPEATDPEAIGQAAALSIPRPAIWAEQLGPLLTSAEMRELLGGISREALSQRVSRGTLLALRDARGKVRYPLFQIEEGAGAPYAEVRELIRLFRERDLSTWELATYMTTPQPTLDGNSPAAWMVEHLPTDALLGAAAEAAAALSR